MKPITKEMLEELGAPEAMSLFWDWAGWEYSVSFGEMSRTLQEDGETWLLAWLGRSVDDEVATLTERWAVQSTRRDRELFLGIHQDLAFDGGIPYQSIALRTWHLVKERGTYLVTDSNGDRYWVKDGRLHRTDGPAVERKSGHRQYWLDGVPQCLSGRHRLG